MGGIAMWIILGLLVLVVVVFLFVTTILDRKKSKKIKIEKDKLLKETKQAIPKIIKKISLVIISNNKNLDNFVPSVGKVKMLDINQKAKKELVFIKKSKDFQLIKENKELFEEFKKHINNLINSKSNNWNKRNVDDVNFILKYKEFEKQRIAKKQAELKKELEENPLKKKRFNFLFWKSKRKVQNNE